MMNQHVREQMDQFNNPFQLKHIKSIHNNSDFSMLGPCVVMASPGFMQSGVSRQLFEAWCDDPRHGVVIAGYTIEGTLANDLLSAPLEIKCLDNRIKPLRCQVEHISFSAHVDYTENKTFIKSVMPDYIILVHGEKTQMKRLKEGLEADMRKNLWPTQHKPSVAMPENGVKVKLRFRKNVMADVVGLAATELLEQLENSSSSGFITNVINTAEQQHSTVAHIPDHALLVTENFTSKLVTAQELGNYTSCKFSRIKERLTIPIPQSLEVLGGPAAAQQGGAGKVVDLLMCHLEEVFDDLCITSRSSETAAQHLVDDRCITIQSLVTLSVGYTSESDANTVLAVIDTATAASRRPTHILVEWTGSPVSDTVADSVAGLVLQAFSTFNSLRRTVTGASSTGNSKRSNRHKRRKTESTTPTAEGEPSVVEGGALSSTDAGMAEEKSDLVEQMIKGEVDPSKRITVKHELQTTKLRALLDLVQHGVYSKVFSEVKINAEGDKLIFRGVEKAQYEMNADEVAAMNMAANSTSTSTGSSDQECPEAFVFVHFADNTSIATATETSPVGGGGEHHAVVHCEQEAFRRIVMQALQLA